MATTAPAPQTETTDADAATLADRLQAWRAGRLHKAPRFTTPPLPFSMGVPARGQQLVSGNLLMAGEYVELRSAAPWTLEMPGPGFGAALHGFGWLEDLAALGTPEARACAQRWTWDWIDRFGGGSGPGWRPGPAGGRLLRLVDHGVFLLRGRPGGDAAAFTRVLARHAAFVSRRWQGAEAGLARLRALCALVAAAHALNGLDGLVAPARAGLGGEAAALVDGAGGVPTRTPDDLLHILALLVRAADLLERGHGGPVEAHRAAILRAAEVIRALAHGDGGLARFNGGGRGMGGEMDRVLATARAPGRRRPGTLAMGYARMTGGRSTLILDAAAPPTGPASANAHAGTLAFEMTSGRRPLIVNCGSGAAFGATWRQAGRATPSHSTLSVDGVSSSRFGEARDLLATVPRQVTAKHRQTRRAQVLEVSHDGYTVSHGLIHARRLHLSADGRHLSGEDRLEAPTRAFRARLTAECRRLGAAEGLPVSLRFHLHPDAAAQAEGDTVTITLRSGEVWQFRHDSAAALTLEPSIYLERDLLKPRRTRQIVLRTRVTEAGAGIGWTLAKARGTPLAVRDVQA